MFAEYSPLFSAGLVSESVTPASPRFPFFTSRLRKGTHDSLPLTVNTTSVSFHASIQSARSPSDENGMFFTFMPHRRHDDAGRSFLSLDLAETQSMRSMSLRRKDTVTTKRTSLFGRSEPTSPLVGSPTSHDAPFSFSDLFSPPPQKTATPSLRRPSREALRLPSPKPAPSSGLPDLPARARRSRPAHLTLSTSITTSPSAASSSTLTHRPTHSEPSLLSPPLTSPGDQSYFSFSPIMSSFSSTFTDSSPPPYTPPPPISATHLRPSPSCRSTASASTRQVNRSAALAALEGRGDVVRPRNFMNMDDDEDENDESVVVTQEARQHRLLQVLREEEDVVIPTVQRERSSESSSSSSSAKRASGSKRSRRSTIESFFSPLTNFIDLRDDDGNSSRGWRSFVELSS